MKFNIFYRFLFFILFSVCVVSCSKKTNYIATYIHYDKDKKNYDDVLFVNMIEIIREIRNYYTRNNNVLNDFSDEYLFFSNPEIVDSYKKLNIPESIKIKFKNESSLVKALTIAKNKNAKLLMFLKPLKIKTTDMYEINFLIVDLADDYKVYKTLTNYKIDRTPIEKRMKLDKDKKIKIGEFLNKEFSNLFNIKDKSRNEILKELTEIIKKTEK